ncbi:hypothetical protein Fot_28819 [Forsythia ovata]|uniref:Uncharacterized protein n=1 Tax=Forsythia ovata TaxID=205694 RepID=A0ABD1TQK7_9LAMI
MRSYLQPLWRRGSLVKEVLPNHTKEVLPITGPTQSLYRGVLPGQTSSPSGPTESYEGGPTYRWSYPTFMERKFTHQGCPTHSGLTESHKGGPTYNLYGEGVPSSRRSYLQQWVEPLRDHCDGGWRLAMTAEQVTEVVVYGVRI